MDTLTKLELRIEHLEKRMTELSIAVRSKEFIPEDCNGFRGSPKSISIDPVSASRE